MKNLKNTQWKSALENDPKGIMVDARTPAEWAEGVIDERAFFMNVLDEADFQKKTKDLDKAKNYYVYCRSGKRSAKACDILEKNGVKETFNLKGGILDWNEQLDHI